MGWASGGMVFTPSVSEI